MSSRDRTAAANTAEFAAISVPAPAAAALDAEPATLSPVRFEERISALDTIRGFSLLGILLMNIGMFGLPASAYYFPLSAGGATGVNLFTWGIISVIADGKMRAIFSLCFGASVYL